MIRAIATRTQAGRRTVLVLIQHGWRIISNNGFTAILQKGGAIG